MHYELPDWLYDYSSPTKKQISSKALFSPVAALQGGRVAAITPSQARKNKSIILDRKIFESGITKQQWLAVVAWLKAQGFPVYLCVQSGPFSNDIIEAEAGRALLENMEQLSTFDEEQDYETVAHKFQLERRSIYFTAEKNAKAFCEALIRCTFLVDYGYFKSLCHPAVLQGQRLSEKEYACDSIEAFIQCFRYYKAERLTLIRENENLLTPFEHFAQSIKHYLYPEIFLEDMAESFYAFLQSDEGENAINYGQQLSLYLNHIARFASGKTLDAILVSHAELIETDTLVALSKVKKSRAILIKHKKTLIKRTPNIEDDMDILWWADLFPELGPHFVDAILKEPEGEQRLLALLTWDDRPPVFFQPDEIIKKVCRNAQAKKIEPANLITLFDECQSKESLQLLFDTYLQIGGSVRNLVTFRMRFQQYGLLETLVDCALKDKSVQKDGLLLALNGLDTVPLSIMEKMLNESNTDFQTWESLLVYTRRLQNDDAWKVIEDLHDRVQLMPQLFEITELVDRFPERFDRICELVDINRFSKGSLVYVNLLKKCPLAQRDLFFKNNIEPYLVRFSQEYIGEILSIYPQCSEKVLLAFDKNIYDAKLLCALIKNCPEHKEELMRIIAEIVCESTINFQEFLEAFSNTSQQNIIQEVIMQNPSVVENARCLYWIIVNDPGHSSVYWRRFSRLIKEDNQIEYICKIMELMPDEALSILEMYLTTHTIDDNDDDIWALTHALKKPQRDRWMDANQSALSRELVRDKVEKEPYDKGLMPDISPESFALYLDNDLMLPRVIDAIQNGQATHLHVLELGRNIHDEESLKRLLTGLSAHCPNLMSMSAYNNIYTMLPDSYRSICTIVPDPCEIHVRSGESKPSTPQQQTRSNENSDYLYISTNANDGGVDERESDGGGFDNVKAGELLNLFDRDKPSVRQKLLTFSAVDSKANQLEKAASAYKKIDHTPRNITPELIVQLRASIARPLYALFVQRLRNGTRNKLLSLDAQEHLLAISKNIDCNIQFERGDDGFIYATPTEDVELSYVLEAEPGIYNTQDNSEISACYQAYMHNIEHASSSDETFPVGDNYSEWLEKVYAERVGACRHRVAAFYNHIRLHYPQALERMRIVGTNGNHVELEVLQNGKWCLLDLGGTVNNSMHYSDDVYQEQMQVADDTNTSDELLVEPKPVSVQRQVEYAAASTIAEAKVKSLQVIRAKIQGKLAHCLAVATPVDVISSDALQQIVTSAAQNSESVLIESQDAEEQINFLLRENGDNPNIVFLNQSVNIGRMQIVLNERGEPRFSDTDTPLERFLRAIHEQNLPTPVIIIDWSQFTSNQTVSLNALFEDQASLYGLSVPKNIQVISVCKETPRDSSFIGRHQHFVKCRYQIQEKHIETLAPANCIVLDMAGLNNPEERLFGKIVEADGGRAWHQSDFCQALLGESGADLAGHYHLSNVVPAERDKFLSKLKTAIARGFYEYNGFKIMLPSRLKISCDDAEFDFAKFSHDGLRIQEDVYAHERAATSTMINSTLFDELIQRNHIQDKKFTEQMGLIEAHANNTLVLYISGALTSSQWYALRYYAQQYHCQLQLQVAPNVPIPAGLSYESVQSEGPVAKENHNTIYLTNDADSTSHEIQGSKEICIIDVEDQSYDDLFARFAYEQHSQGFENFRFIRSDVLNKLARGDHVVLRGEFAPMLLEELHPIICNGQINIDGELIELPGRLDLVIQDKRIQNQSTPIPSELVFLKNKISCVYRKPQPKDGSQIVKETIVHSEQTVDLAQARDEADKFLDKRTKSLLELLSNHPMIHLKGQSGIGKSALMSHLKQTGEFESVRVYQELSQLDSWAKDDSKAMKVLFIDEANIQDKELTSFKGLYETPRSILYKGKIYPLTNAHKVVFASNDLNYGGTRADQKLFHDCSIPEFHMIDFPPAYIYAKILLPMATKIKKDLARDNESLPVSFDHDFKVMCQRYLQYYIKRREKGHATMTVRELQAMVLNFVSYQRRNKFQIGVLDDTRIKRDTSGYIETVSSAELRVALSTFLQTKQLQHAGHVPYGPGLNAVLIEGEPGTGKSKTIAHMLTQFGYVLVDPNANDSTRDKMAAHQCVKIDASLPIEIKRRMLLSAFHAGHAVWIDELNSMSNEIDAEKQEGFEKFINSILTGRDPDTGGPPQKPGFMLLATGNSIALDGRDSISKAFRHRSLQLSLDKPGQRDLHKHILDLLKRRKMFLADDGGAAMASLIAGQLHELMLADPYLTFRTIQKNYDAILDIYQEAEIEVQAKPQDLDERAKDQLQQTLGTRPTSDSVSAAPILTDLHKWENYPQESYNGLVMQQLLIFNRNSRFSDDVLAVLEKACTLLTTHKIASEGSPYTNCMRDKILARAHLVSNQATFANQDDFQRLLAQFDMAPSLPARSGTKNTPSKD